MLKQKNNIFALTCSSIVFLLVWYFYTTSSYNGITISGISANIVFYISSILVFLISFLFFSLVFKNAKLKFLDNEIVAKWVPIVEVIAIGYILVWNYLNENYIYIEDTAEDYIRHNVFPLVVIGVGILVVLFVENISIDFKSKFRWIIAMLVSFVAALCEYTPNPFADQGGGIYHIDAYTTSVFNLLNGEPFSEINRCIYGHYAFFYYPITKLIGGYMGVTICVSIVAFVTIFLFSYLGMLVIKSNKIFFLYELSSLFLITEIYYKGVYWQGFPHRYLFPVIVITLVVINETKHILNKKLFLLVCWFVCLLSIIWNLETGIVCSLTYLIYSIVKEFRLSNIIKNFLLFIISCVGSYGLTASTNKVIGGPWLSVKEFIYPILSNDYKVENLAVSILPGLHTSSLITLFFAITAIVAIFDLFKKCKMDKSLSLIIVVTSLNALGVYVYGINRPAYGSPAILMLQFVLIISLIIDRINTDDEILFVKNTKYVIKKLLTVVLILLSTESVIYMGVTLYNKSETSWNKTNFNTVYLFMLQSSVEEGTPALGIGTNVLYAALGWDTGYHVSDFPDINGTALEYVNDDVMNHKYILVNEYCGRIDNLSNFEFVNQFGFEGMTYYLCENTKYVGE